MRIGHCLTKSHLHKLHIEEDPYSEFGYYEDINHIFLYCPNNIHESFRKEGTPAPFHMPNVLPNPTSVIIKTLFPSYDITLLIYNTIFLHCWFHFPPFFPVN